MKSIVCVLVSLLILNGVCRAGFSYVAAVGDDDTDRYLKVAQIKNIASDPNVRQVEINISDQFDWVNDVAFLHCPGESDPQIAVLGNCNVFVPFKEGWWWGNDHIIDGKIVIYQVTDGDPFQVNTVAEATYLETFETVWFTVDDDTISGQPGQSYQISGLPSGGFVVECNAMRRACSLAGCVDDGFSSYNKLLFFDDCR